MIEKPLAPPPDQESAVSPRQIAEDIVRGHADRCVGDYESTQPWCSCAPLGTPLCQGCQKLADAITAALLERETRQ